MAYPPDPTYLRGLERLREFDAAREDTMAKIKVESNIQVYEVTNESARPFLLAAYTRDNSIGLDTDYEMIKQLVKVARQNRWAIHTINIKVGEDGTWGELWGTTS